MTPEQALQTAKDAYMASTTYVDSNYRKQWEDAIRMFQSRHAADSKYHSDAYKYRSKLFRPKTRSVIRKNEGAAAAAFFSNMDVVNIAPVNGKNAVQVLGAQLYKELLQHRLTKTIPWFMTLLGALQDAMTVGVVCSHQYWRYRERVRSTRSYMVDEATGAHIMSLDGGPMMFEEHTTQILEDRPCIDLIPVENLRIDQGASWVDPVNTSPYLIHLIPMYAGDVKLMGQPNAKTGEPGWNVPEDGKLRSAMNQQYDQTRQVREQNREDSQAPSKPLSQFDIVWVHKNIVREEGEDFCYYTLGTEHMLSPEPRPLAEYSPLKKRPYAMGVAVIEAHKIYPDGLSGIGRELQKEANEVANSRRDNVLLVLNKRWKAKRGAQVDIKSLVRNVPGSVTLMQSMDDAEPVEFTDVTASAYAEQDRLNVDYDELVGNFSTSSVMTNRKLNETVGGMAMLGQGASQLQEYTIRTFVETWVEPVLGQTVELEKAFEADELILKLMGQKLGQEVTSEMFDADVELNVNVGIGATDPIQRINRLLTAARSIAEIAHLGVAGLKLGEVSKEVFGAIGYRDGGRFWDEEENAAQDPRLQQAMAVIEQLQAELQQAQQNMQAKMEEIHIKAAAAMEKAALERDKTAEQLQLARDKAMEEKRLALEKLHADFAIEQQRIRDEMVLEAQRLHNELLVERERLINDRKIAMAEIEQKRDEAAMTRELQAAAARAAA